MRESHWMTMVFLCPLICSGQVDSGLVANFSFNRGNGIDDREKYEAKLYGAKLTQDRFGNENAAVYLQGNFDSYINLGSDPNLKQPQTTISVWINISQPTLKGKGINHNPIIFTRVRSSEYFNEAFFIGYEFNLGTLNVNTTLSQSKVVTLYPTRPTSLREWHHVAMTFDDEFLSFYIDGVLDNKAAKNFRTCYLDNDSILVGLVWGDTNQRCLNASVDDIQIFNRVLSPEEVQRLYQAPNPNKTRIIIRWVLYYLAGVVLVLLMIWLVKRRIATVLKAEKERNQLLNNWYEQENRVLSAQMDPHFIFNSLNTIQQFIITNDNDKAQLYLSKFSRLIRKILESNTQEYITLADEIDIIEKYLEIESLRFNNVFKYRIVIDPAINPNKLKIPHFLVQPLVENAIWHGLLPKEGEKELSVSFEVISEKLISCVIEDNGVGMNASANSKIPVIENKKRSLAINFIEQRLLLLGKLKNVSSQIRISDKISSDGIPGGTIVKITIPIIEGS
jgi:two-component sensor histidine kinase